MLGQRRQWNAVPIQRNVRQRAQRHGTAHQEREAARAGLGSEPLHLSGCGQAEEVTVRRVEAVDEQVDAFWLQQSGLGAQIETDHHIVSAYAQRIEIGLSNGGVVGDQDDP